MALAEINVDVEQNYVNVDFSGVCNINVKIWNVNTVNSGLVEWRQQGMDCSENQYRKVFKEILDEGNPVSFVIHLFDDELDRAALASYFLCDEVLDKEIEDALIQFSEGYSGHLLGVIESEFKLDNVNVSDVRRVRREAIDKVLPTGFSACLKNQKEIVYTMVITID
ncbi:hypothetical protein [Thalassolituus sp.]|uniref:hypothetical protein n=1 Tax=Thalassolituus sp. TaxID=2030822 RepID=UPI003510D466